MKLKQQLAAAAAAALLVLVAVAPAFAEEGQTDPPPAQGEGDGGGVGADPADPADPSAGAADEGEAGDPPSAQQEGDAQPGADASGDTTAPSGSEDTDAEAPEGGADPPIALAAAGASVNQRLQGADRYATAVQVSKHAYPSASGGTVIVATGENYPDALSAAPLAAKRSAPLLLTLTAGIPDSTLGEINRLKPKHILIIGSESAVSAAVKTQLENLRWQGAGPQVRRISGADRYETSAAIAREGWGTPTGSDFVANAFVVTGEGYADALSAGAAASRINGPVLLVPGMGTAAPGGVTAVLANTARLYVAGSTAVVSDAVLASLTAGSARTLVARYAGTDRYDTSAKIANALFSAPATTSYWATGSGFADALAGAAVAGARGVPLLLALPDCVPTAVYDANDRVNPGGAYLLGSPAALADSVQHGNECSASAPSGMTAADAAGSRAVYAALNADRYQRGLPAARLADSAKGQTAFAWSAAMAATPAQPAKPNPAIASQAPWTRLEYVLKNPTESGADPFAAFAHMSGTADGQSVLAYQPAAQRVLVSIGWIQRGAVSWLTVQAGV